jgi:hypothetical protein
VGRCSDILRICAYGASVQAGIVCPRKIVD